jgi:Gly-Xaa carboxypeptidase
VALHNSLEEVKQRSVHLIKPIAKKYGLTIKAFQGDDVEFHHSPDMNGHYDVDYNGTLVLSATQATNAAPLSPASGPIWDIFSGTIQHSLAFDKGTVVPVGELMGGNTDTRHYLGM